MMRFHSIERRGRRGTGMIFVLILMLILAIFTQQMLSSLAAKDRALRERWRTRQAREIAELFVRYTEAKISASDDYPGEVQLFEIAEAVETSIGENGGAMQQLPEVAEVTIERFETATKSDDLAMRPYRIKVTMNPKPGSAPDYVLESIR